MGERIDVLIKAYLSGDISKVDRALLKKWVLSNNENKKEFISRIKKYANADHTIDFDAHTAFLKFLERKDQRSIFQYRKWMSYAAVILFLIGMTIVSRNLNYPDYDGLENANTNQETLSDINGITITLSDGTQKTIDKNAFLEVTDKRGRVVANNKAGALTFTSESNEFQEPIYNEIYIPYGQKFEIALGDGTRVHWLGGDFARTLHAARRGTRGKWKPS